MGRHRPWARSGNTPDWMDVEMALRAVGDMHSGLTMVTISPCGPSPSGGMIIAVSTSWERLPGSELDPLVVTERQSKAYDPVSLPAFVLGGVYAHEDDLEKAYAAGIIPK